MYAGPGAGAPDWEAGGQSAAESQQGTWTKGAASGREDTKAEASANTARVRAARRAWGEPGKNEARATTAEGQQERTAASTPGAQPTRTEPPEKRTAETTGSTGTGEP